MPRPISFHHTVYRFTIGRCRPLVLENIGPMFLGIRRCSLKAASVCVYIYISVHSYSSNAFPTWVRTSHTKLNGIVGSERSEKNECNLHTSYGCTTKHVSTCKSQHETVRASVSEFLSWSAPFVCRLSTEKTENTLYAHRAFKKGLYAVTVKPCVNRTCLTFEYVVKAYMLLTRVCVVHSCTTSIRLYIDHGVVQNEVSAHWFDFTAPHFGCQFCFFKRAFPFVDWFQSQEQACEFMRVFVHSLWPWTRARKHGYRCALKT